MANTSMWASTKIYQAGLTVFTSKCNRMAICSTAPKDSTEACKKGTTCFMAKATSAVKWSNIKSTASGWVVYSTSANQVTVTTSGKARTVCMLGGTSYRIAITRCTTRNIKATDKVNIPSIRWRIGKPSSS